MTLAPEIGTRLADRVQEAVPFVERPFERLARDLGVEPSGVLAQLVAWQEEGLLREISAVLESEALGYESALAAARVRPADLERVVAVVNAHPTVTHNYLGDHDYNVWFTIAVPEEMGLERTLSLLSAEAGGVSFRPLPRTAVFKIGVRFRMDSLENDSPSGGAGRAVRLHPDERTRSILRALQTPLPLVDRPFDELARAAGVEVEQLLYWGEALLGRVIRRYVGTFRHRHLGVRGNAMVVWKVPPGSLEDLGRALALVPQVSQCYARTTLDDFPYALYSMMHGPDEAAVRELARRTAAGLGISDYLVLASRRELKNCRLRFFLPELETWWSERWPWGR